MMLKNREEAGKYLGIVLKSYHVADKNPFVLAIPRGGVTVGYHIAEILGCPLDVIISRKIRHPLNEEIAVGYAVEDCSPVLGYNPKDTIFSGILEGSLDNKIQQALNEVWQKVELFRKGECLPDLADYDVILVDDGLATGWTLQGALTYLQTKNKAKSITIAVPIILLKKTLEIFRAKVDKLVYLSVSDERAIGFSYDNFSQVSDEEVLKFLGK